MCHSDLRLGQDVSLFVNNEFLKSKSGEKIVTLDGPSEEIVGFGGVAMAEDGTGGAVYLERVDGRIDASSPAGKRLRPRDEGLGEFWKWARNSDMRTREALGVASETVT